MGGALGRFIYLIDAWDDAAKDERHGSYNPLLPLRREPDYEERVYQILTMEIAECAMEFEKLPIVQDAGIIRNVLYSGVWTVYSRRREAAEKKRKAASGRRLAHRRAIDRKGQPHGAGSLSGARRSFHRLGR